MNREIEFRGKRCADGVWVYGDYVAGDSCDVSFIFPCDITSLFCVGGRYEVYENTIGEFTGLVDKNGVKIFEGDIVRKRDLTFGLKFDGVVVYSSEIGCFRIHSENNGVTMRMGFEASDVYNDGQCTVPVKYDYEVIGNIYDNPELLSTK